MFSQGHCRPSIGKKKMARGGGNCRTSCFASQLFTQCCRGCKFERAEAYWASWAAPISPEIASLYPSRWKSTHFIAMPADAFTLSSLGVGGASYNILKVGVWI